MQNKLRMKKLDLYKGLNRFFNEFMERNKLIFAKLKDSVNVKENTLLDSLEHLKKKVSLFYNEEEMINDASAFNSFVKKTDMELRKGNNKK